MSLPAIISVGTVASPNGLPPREVARTRHFWTNREIGLLKALYPSRGMEACIDALPGRTAPAIYNMARKLGLFVPGGKPRRRAWPTSPTIDGMIRRAYENPSPGAIRDLACEIGRPRQWVRARAMALGIATPSMRPAPWSADEDDIIARLASRHLKTIQKALARAGFSRTPCAIAVRLKRIGQSTVDPERWSATGLAELLGVNRTTVIGWIERGWLKAKRKGTARLEVQGGDSWSIHRKDVRAFVIENAARVDLRKVDKFWFIDLMAAAP